MSPKRIFFFLLFLLSGIGLFSQTIPFCEIRFLNETKKLARIIGKETDPFPLYGRGIGFEAGVDILFKNTTLTFKTGVVEFFPNTLQLPAGPTRYQSAMFPIEAQYYSPRLINSDHFYLGLRGTGGLYFISTLEKGPSAFAPVKSSRAVPGWGLAIYCGYNIYRTPRTFIPMLVADFCRIGNHNFSSLEIIFPIDMGK